MRKNLCIVCFLALFICFNTFATDSYQVEQLMIGYVQASVSFSAKSIDESLPFDLDGPDVKFNGSSTQVSGIRIGEFTLISNSSQMIELTITHTPLRLSGSSGTGNGEHIDYRLYAITGDNLFESCRSDVNASTPTSATEKIVIGIAANSSTSLLERSLYVSLDEGSSTQTEEVLAGLRTGTYKSTIYFVLMGGS